MGNKLYNVEVLITATIIKHGIIATSHEEAKEKALKKIEQSSMFDQITDIDVIKTTQYGV